MIESRKRLHEDVPLKARLESLGKTGTTNAAALIPAGMPDDDGELFRL